MAAHPSQSLSWQLLVHSSSLLGWALNCSNEDALKAHENGLGSRKGLQTPSEKSKSAKFAVEVKSTSGEQFQNVTAD